MRANDARWHGRKLHVHLPPEMLAEIRAEASRLNVKISVLMRRAWRMARPGIATLPASSVGVPGEPARKVT